jgi:hypothetical protein
MRLYRTTAGRWVGTLAEAGRKGSWEQVEVPTDKPGLLDWLNMQAGAAPAPVVPAAAVRTAPKLNLDALPATDRPDATTGRLSRWAQAYERNPESMSAHTIMNEVVWTLPLDDALAWAECAIARVRSLTAGAEPAD